MCLDSPVCVYVIFLVINTSMFSLVILNLVASEVWASLSQRLVPNDILINVLF